MPGLGPTVNNRLVLAAVADGILTAIFYYLYRRRHKFWSTIRSAKIISSASIALDRSIRSLLFGHPSDATIEQELGGKQKRPFVAIEGDIEPVKQNQLIGSYFYPDLDRFKAVYRLNTIEERTLSRFTTHWYDVRRIVSEDVAHIPSLVVVNIDKKRLNAHITSEEQQPSMPSTSGFNWHSLYTWVYPLGKLVGISKDLPVGSVEDVSIMKMKNINFELPPLIVADPSLIEEMLVQVHSEFDEYRHNALQSLGHILFGNIPLGRVHREQMLLSGTRVYAYGFADVSPGRCHLMPDSPFIISSLPPDQLAEKARRPVIIYGVLSLIGFGALVAILWKLSHDWWKSRRLTEAGRLLRDDAAKRLAERRQQPGAPSSAATDVDSLCVICLDARRDVALLPCGHVCMCSGCVSRMPDQICPLCRSNITGQTALFFS